MLRSEAHFHFESEFDLKKFLKISWGYAPQTPLGDTSDVSPKTPATARVSPWTQNTSRFLRVQGEALVVGKVQKTYRKGFLVGVWGQRPHKLFSISQTNSQGLRNITE